MCKLTKIYFYDCRKHSCKFDPITRIKGLHTTMSLLLAGSHPLIQPCSPFKYTKHLCDQNAWSGILDFFGVKIWKIALKLEILNLVLVWRKYFENPNPEFQKKMWQFFFFFSIVNIFLKIIKSRYLFIDISDF